MSHCGKEIVEGEERTLAAELRAMAEERGVEASIDDGLEWVVR